jgi:protein-S-isoprenylcysteine O-methyltransferase Ste14
MAVYLATAFVWRSYSVWKHTGINPVVFKGTDDAHDFIGRVSKLILALVFAVVLMYSLFPRAYRFTMPFDWMEYRWVQIVGVALLLASLIWTAMAQRQMGPSWRIGIDKENRTRLVHGGLYNISRNPIYVGIILTLLGLFFVIPNALTLLVLVLGVVLVSIQARLEEEYLLKAHGEAYADYRRRVRRWL